VSGKVWKDAPAKRASSDKNAVVGSSWDKKMAEKAARKAFQEQKAAAVTAVKEKKRVRWIGVGGWVVVCTARGCLRNCPVVSSAGWQPRQDIVAWWQRRVSR
jgi:hypothetical protein